MLAGLDGTTGAADAPPAAAVAPMVMAGSLAVPGGAQAPLQTAIAGYLDHHATANVRGIDDEVVAAMTELMAAEVDRILAMPATSFDDIVAKALFCVRCWIAMTAI
ncbi:hypothetical protein [Belnapia moabensis]|uniref:hypothetical protein n=1 Tax=Belnapia moabensis TaxID=365533 RepID=UPI0005B95BC4|nr:hypothetical protein [Belnapia moabensis]